MPNSPMYYNIALSKASYFENVSPILPQDFTLHLSYLSMSIPS
jgi:hypothetical protein